MPDVRQRAVTKPSAAASLRSSLEVPPCTSSAARSPSPISTYGISTIVARSSTCAHVRALVQFAASFSAQPRASRTYCSSSSAARSPCASRRSALRLAQAGSSSFAAASRAFALFAAHRSSTPVRASRHSHTGDTRRGLVLRQRTPERCRPSITPCSVPASFPATLRSHPAA